MTATFKHTKTALVREGYDPAAIADALYFDDRERQAFVRLDTSLYDRIQSGQLPGHITMFIRNRTSTLFRRRAHVPADAAHGPRSRLRAPALSIAPQNPTIAVGQTQQFTASGGLAPTGVSAGGEYTCVRLPDGTGRCAGRNQFGQLGDGTGTNSSVS